MCTTAPQFFKVWKVTLAPLRHYLSRPRFLNIKEGHQACRERVQCILWLPNNQATHDEETQSVVWTWVQYFSTLACTVKSAYRIILLVHSSSSQSLPCSLTHLFSLLPSYGHTSGFGVLLLSAGLLFCCCTNCIVWIAVVNSTFILLLMSDIANRKTSTCTSWNFKKCKKDRNTDSVEECSSSFATGHQASSILAFRKTPVNGTKYKPSKIGTILIFSQPTRSAQRSSTDGESWISAPTECGESFLPFYFLIFISEVGKTPGSVLSVVADGVVARSLQLVKRRERERERERERTILSPTRKRAAFCTLPL